jgi:hypothetical protein
MHSVGSVNLIAGTGSETPGATLQHQDMPRRRALEGHVDAEIADSRRCQLELPGNRA